jgi:hypothetical protein
VKLCSVCGNDIPDDAVRCRFCGSRQAASAGKPAKRQRIATVNLEKGSPTVAEAIALLDRRIADSRAQGTLLLRVIHGWGSSGKGGSIKKAVMKHVARLRRQRTIRDHVPGDNYSEVTNAGCDLLSRFPDLRETLRTDRENPGITFVLL